MKKSGPAGHLMAIAVAGLLASAPAAANVQIYGLVDLGVERVNNVASERTAATRSQFGTAPSRLGFRGSEDLGDGLLANFVLEMGLNADNGTLGNGGRGFGRAATVGLSGQWGALTVGRQLTMMFYTIADTEIMVPGAYSSASLDPYLANARADNSLAYRGKFGNLSVGGLYSLGRDVVNTNSPAGTNCPGEGAGGDQACRAVSLLVKYETADWGLVAGGDRLNGGPGAYGNLTRGDLQDLRVTLNGFVRLGSAKFAAGLIRRDNDGSAATPRSDLRYASASWRQGVWQLEVELLDLDFKDSADGARLTVLRGFHHFSKRTSAYVTMGFMNNRGNLARPVSGVPGLTVAPGGSQTGLMVGLRQSF